MKQYFKKHWHVFLLIILALFTRFFFLSYPAEVVFDEVHFGKFVGAYFTHQYYFDIHPPLGKMLVAGFAKLAGFNLRGQDPATIFAQIGGKFNAKDLFILRFLPALASALFVLLIYKLIIAMGLSKKSAFLGAFLVMFDNAILTQSKLILVDIFLLLFGFSSLTFFFLSKQGRAQGKNRILFLLASAFFATLSFSIKWTGLSFLGIILLWILIDFFRELKVKKFLQGLAIFIVIPSLFYFLIGIIHLKIVDKSGPGDAYMTAAFQKSLQGNQVQENVKPLSLWQKFVELNIATYRYNAGLKAEHPYSSKWYQWPIAYKPIWYWVKTEGDKTGNIYLVGNPLIWFPALFAIAIGIVLIFIPSFRRKITPLVYMLLFGYFLNLLPYLSIKRVTFLYHYFPSLVFGILILALLQEKIFEKQPLLRKSGRDKKEPKEKVIFGFASKLHFVIYSGYLLFVLVMFLVISPISYGFLVSARMRAIYEIFIKILSS